MMRWRIAMVRRSDSDDAMVRKRYCDGTIALLQLCDREDAMLYRVIVRFFRRYRYHLIAQRAIDCIAHAQLKKEMASFIK